jgi:hypothetical protein
MTHNTFAALGRSPGVVATPWRAGASLLLVGLYGAICVYAWLGLVEWPNAGSLWQIVLIFVFPGLVYQAAFAICVLRTRAPWPRTLWSRAFCPRCLAIAVGLGLYGVFLAWSEDVALTRFQARQQPLVEVLRAAVDPCAAFQARAGGTMTSRRQPRLFVGNGQLVLAFPVSSIDIDGGTIYIVSTESAWRLHHNDNREARADFEKLISGMTPCLPPGAASSPSPPSALDPLPPGTISSP